MLRMMDIFVSNLDILVLEQLVDVDLACYCSLVTSFFSLRLFVVLNCCFEPPFFHKTHVKFNCSFCQRRFFMDDPQFLGIQQIHLTQLHRMLFPTPSAPIPC